MIVIIWLIFGIILLLTFSEMMINSGLDNIKETKNFIILIGRILLFLFLLYSWVLVFLLIISGKWSTFLN